MSDKIFLDTNILDTGDHTKQACAKRVILQLLEEDRGVISAQVLNEFFVTVTMKIAKPLSIDMVHRQKFDKISVINPFK